MEQLSITNVGGLYWERQEKKRGWGDPSWSITPVFPGDFPGLP